MIDFKQIPQVALDFMNSDHAEAIDLLTQLNDALSQNDKASVTGCLQALLQHNREHFAREERQMQAYNFPPYPVHKNEHDQVLIDMQEKIDAWQANADKAALEEYVHQTLPYWFVNHISTMDMVTAQFINNHGGPNCDLL